jgi:hypothetical protein
MKTHWILGGVTLAGILGFWGWRAVQKGTAVSPQAEEHSLRWQPIEVSNWLLIRGQQHHYQLHYSGQLPGSKQSVDFLLKGRFSLTVLDELDTGYRAWINFETSPDSPALDSIPESVRKTLQKSLQRGALVRLAARGFDVNLEEGQVLEPMAQSFWQTLTDRLRVLLPPRLEHHQFTQTEDISGLPIQTAYDVDPSLAHEDLQRESIYVHKSMKSREGAARELEAESLIMLRPGFEGLERLDFQGTEYVTLQNQKIGAASELILRWQGQESLDEHRLQVIERQIQEAQGTDVVSKQRELMIQSVALGKTQWSDLWQAMQGLDPHSKVPQDLYLRLKAWIVLKPADLKLLYEQIKDRPADDPALRLAIKALAAAGHETAQQSLVDLLQYRLEDRILAKRLITQLGLVLHPSPSAQGALESIIDSQKEAQLGRSSHLALGIMGQRLSRQDDESSRERSKRIEERAWALLRKDSQHSDTTRDALAMLGNIGPHDSRGLEVFLESADPEVRAQAYFALRFARDPETPYRLVAYFQKEAAAAAQKQILQALDLRPADALWFDAIKLLISHPLKKDDQLQIASALARNARMYREESLSLLESLETQAQADESLRRTLARYREQASRNKGAVF